MIDISELRPWTKNPRAIEKADYERLKKRCEGAQFKPLLVMSDGTVLGGNMRLLAYNDLGKRQIWVSIIEFEHHNDKYCAYINGELDTIDNDPRLFDSVEDGMLHYAITDNESFGKYMDQELAELVEPSHLDLKDYKIQLSGLTTLEDLKLSFGPDGSDSQEPLDEKIKEPKNATCPECGHTFSI
jgi:hypothetical protein